MRKRIFLKTLALLAIVSLTTITGCKKGENDPFLSLKSRKARISGEWKLTAGTETSTDNFGGFSGSSTTTYTGTTYNEDGNTGSYSQTMTIEKDGTFTMTILQDGITSTISGNWFFAGKIKDAELKNKEAIVFSELVYTSPGGTSTYTGIWADQIMMIDQLKNKEMIFKGSFTYSDSDGDSGTYNYNMTFEKN